MSEWRSLSRRLPSAALALLGVAGLYKASSLAFGSVRQPDSGFYPTLVCVALIVLGTASLATREPADAPETEPEPHGTLRVWLVVAALAVYALALKPVGFLTCTVALLLLLLKGMGGVPWRGSVVSAVLGTLACYGLFTRLGVPLPAGILGF